jgi:hypothetical protein
LILAPLATVAAFEGLAAERTTGIGPGTARRGARHVAGIKRLALRGPWCPEPGLTKGPCGWQISPL